MGIIAAESLPGRLAHIVDDAHLCFEDPLTGWRWMWASDTPLRWKSAKAQARKARRKHWCGRDNWLLPDSLEATSRSALRSPIEAGKVYWTRSRYTRESRQYWVSDADSSDFRLVHREEEAWVLLLSR